jgi:Protein of unknown function (DUF2752)
MELGLAASAHGGLARRAAPIVGGCALAACTAFVATHDPSAAGSRYPACVFHQITGLWCPGCGLTRGTYELLHGHVGAALGYNIFTPVALVAIVVAWMAWVRVAWGRQGFRMPHWAGRWPVIVLPVLIIAYGVLRNLPVTPLRTLAP